MEMLIMVLLGFIGLWLLAALLFESMLVGLLLVGTVRQVGKLFGPQPTAIP
ncbi:hypothetical protein JCM17960_22370 [Magnetospira thiophila]